MPTLTRPVSTFSLYRFGQTDKRRRRVIHNGSANLVREVLNKQGKVKHVVNAVEDSHGLYREVIIGSEYNILDCRSREQTSSLPEKSS